MSAATYKGATVIAAPLIWHLQHDGSHEQTRWDAMAWLETYTPAGYSRCTCKKCERLWSRDDLAQTGSLAGLALAAKGEQP